MNAAPSELRGDLGFRVVLGPVVRCAVGEDRLRALSALPAWALWLWLWLYYTTLRTALHYHRYTAGVGAELQN